jgi:cytidylate kinase
MTVAIDGPAAAGKSTVARNVAARLGLTYVDTGAMYRALTLKALETGTDPEDGDALARLAEATEVSLLPPSAPGSHQRVMLDGRDVTRDIRARPVDQAVSPVSRHPAVRAWFKTLQRKMADAGGVVMEGRDIGTAVLPDADAKIYLDAALECRVARRYREFTGKGCRLSEEQVREDMVRRDAIDSSRETAPLSVAPDAVRVDTTHKALEEVIDEVTRLCLLRGRNRG